MDREGETADAAAEAFEAIRAEVALLRRAVEGLAAEKVSATDYTVTLGEISRDQRLTAQHMNALASSPVLSLTPAAIGAQVKKVAADLRQGDRQMLDGARRELEVATKAITTRVASARTRDRQLYHLVGLAAGGFVAGMLLLSLLAGPVARAFPTSWHAPERIAAWTIGASMLEAGKRLIAAGDTADWKAGVPDERTATGSRTQLERRRSLKMQHHRSTGHRDQMPSKQ